MKDEMRAEGWIDKGSRAFPRAFDLAIALLRAFVSLWSISLQWMRREITTEARRARRRKQDCCSASPRLRVRPLRSLHQSQSFLAFVRLRVSVVYSVSREIIPRIIIPASRLSVFVVNLSSVDEKKNHHGDTENTEKKAGLSARREVAKHKHIVLLLCAFAPLRETILSFHPPKFIS